MTAKFVPLFIPVMLAITMPATAQIKPAPWPEKMPEFQSAVFARAGVTVRDIDESLKFYRDILGMTVIHDRKAMFDPRLVEFAGLENDRTIRLVILRPAITGDAKFHAGYIALSEISDAEGKKLSPKEPVSGDGSDPGSIMLQFMVEDAKLVHQKVRQLGYEIIAAPDPEKPHGELLVRDPNGIRFWITDRYSRAILIE
ncbi:VOC family protein [Parasphingorhabdus sp.]|uniref:VOC family protein n=1 Tax=Parasphingorhabdus sp. TaxID=2709688 RepID=UPI0032644332